MRIPTEAELIEMERRADKLASLAADELDAAKAREERGGSSFPLDEEIERAELEAVVAGDVSRLLHLYRTLRKVA